MAFTYPLMLDLCDRLVVIIGAGGVAARKLKTLLEAGANRIRVVAPRFDAAFPAAAAIERVNGTYESGHLEGAALVFAATDSADVNERIVADARARGVLANRADDADGGDFSTPAVLRDDCVMVTVSTGGSPALAAAIRDDLRPHLDRRKVKMATVMQHLRRGFLAKCADPADRRALMRDLASEEAISALDRAGVLAVRDLLRERHPHLEL